MVKQQNVLTIILFIILMITLFVISGVSYNRGYEKANSEFKEYRDNNYIFHSEWNNSERHKDSYSEFLSYNYVFFDAFRGGEDYYVLSFKNYDEPVGFEITYNFNKDLCTLRVYDLVTFENTKEYEIEGKQ